MKKTIIFMLIIPLFFVLFSCQTDIQPLMDRFSEHDYSVENARDVESYKEAVNEFSTTLKGFRNLYIIFDSEDKVVATMIEFRSYKALVDALVLDKDDIGIYEDFINGTLLIIPVTENVSLILDIFHNYTD